MMKRIWEYFFADGNWFFTIVLLMTLAMITMYSLFYFSPAKEYAVTGTVIDKYVKPPTSGFLSSTSLHRITMVDIDDYGVYMVNNDDVYYGTEISDKIEMKLKIIKRRDGAWKLETTRRIRDINFLSWENLEL